jgi:hypothetical protein
MPATRRSVGALQPINDNAQPAQPPATPGKQVKTLKAELDKKDVENKALLDNISSLTSALGNLNLVKDKMVSNNNVVDSKQSKKKDKDAPVPAKTAYKFYCDDHPKPEGVDMRLVWKECAADARAKYTAMAEADKTRYQQEFKTYNDEKVALEQYYGMKKQEIAMQFYEAHLSAQAALEKSDAEKKGKKKAAKDPEAPKHPTSSYMYFAIQQREVVAKKNPNSSPTEISKILGESWNQLEKGKMGKKGAKKYEDLAAVDKARYENEKAEYDAMVAERNAQLDQEKLERLQQEKEEAMKLFQETNVPVSISSVDEVSVLTEDSKPKKKKDPNAPKKGCTAYLFFCNENRASIKASMTETTTNAELLTEVGRQWKELSDKKKEKYNKMADKEKARYAKEMEKYNAEKK